MTFFYYEIPTSKFIIATNVKAISEFSGIPYHKIYGWFNNDATGPMAHIEEGQFICARSELVRGKQRLQNKNLDDSNKKQDDKPGPSPDQTDNKGTKIHQERNVPKEFNDFFSDVGEKT
jgi:hypothetical protein